MQSLARHGFERFYFINGHGGNIATVTAAFSEIYAGRSLERGSNAPSLKCKLRNWWESDKVKALSKELYGDAEGSHATPSEVAMTQQAIADSLGQVDETDETNNTRTYAETVCLTAF